MENAKGTYSSGYDVVVVGSGIAGMLAAIKASRFARVCLLTKDALNNTNTWLAQGGIAAALADDDSPEQHLEDTLMAGSGLCNIEAVKVMVEEGPQCIEGLLSMNMPFERIEGRLAMTREGAHSKNRIVYAGGDATGRILYETLKKQLLSSRGVDIREHTFVTELLAPDGEIVGVRTLSGEVLPAGSVILATGGLGRVFSCTTNPPVATGDGIAMAYNAGATITDMEFVQFHPTVFQSPQGDMILISEAVRGEGAILRNCRGERFMQNYHEMGELGPRDVVSRAIVDQMKKDGSSYVYLDITFREPAYLKKRFPTIYSMTLQHGLDLAKDWLPIIPAAHYAIGGVQTGLFGETNVGGLYACGEVACTGVHGANRLASNSLLEGLVFAERVVRMIEKTGKEPPVNLQRGGAAKGKTISLQGGAAGKLREELRSLMFSNAGILREEKGLLAIRRFIKQHADFLEAQPKDRLSWELRNLFIVAGFIVNSALLRTESRGCHYRVDYPQPDEAWRLRHLCTSVS
ncbi:MAG: L-aspartate oxidase [Firmicutes bacterium]|nr:L-aspartate oxidase [Bacillota bacterium]